MQHGRNAIDAAKQVSAPRLGPWGLSTPPLCGWCNNARLQWPDLEGAGPCAQAGVKHVVLSTLEDPAKLLPEGALPELKAHPGYVVAHFQTKAAIQVRRGAPCCIGKRSGPRGGPAICQRRTAHLVLGEGGRALARSLRGRQLHAPEGLPCTIGKRGAHRASVATQRSASSVNCRPLGRTWLHAARARLGRAQPRPHRPRAAGRSTWRRRACPTRRCCRAASSTTTPRPLCSSRSRTAAAPGRTTSARRRSSCTPWRTSGRAPRVRTAGRSCLVC